MFRKQDFKKVDLLGNGKKNTKIYKVLHIASGRYYALKEVEAKSLDKLNEYKVSNKVLKINSNTIVLNYRKRPSSYLRPRTIRTSSSSTVTSFMKRCIIRTASASFASISSKDKTSSTSSGSASRQICSGSQMK